MSNWRCGGCKKIYEFKDFMNLAKTQVVKEDKNPSEEHGFTSVCSCGYRFHLDKWVQKDIVEVKKAGAGTFEVEVSTVDLELEHMGGMYFETMIFPKTDGLICHHQWRYRNKDDAMKGHQKIVDNLLRKNFTLKVSQRELVL